MSKFIPVAISCHDMSDINWCQFVIVEVEDSVNTGEFRAICNSIPAAEFLDPESLITDSDEYESYYTVFTPTTLDRIKNSLDQRITGTIAVVSAEGIAYLDS
jgi:hypothetical protein